MSAIAVGIAKGATAAAHTYAAERYQGGSRIEEHPAVKMLIAGSEAAIQAAEAMVFSLRECNVTTPRQLLKPAAAKLAVTELCAHAVTDCLQVFGGYGYMEDFGMEKRLRDVTVLKSAFGSPLFLKQFVFDSEKEGGR
jgi:alkylation response protein AidB-like acyl-CoA dehydrogenase